MKTIQLYLIVLVLSSIFNTAQAQTKFGLRAGINFSNSVINLENGEKEHTSAIPGIQAGLTVDIPLVGNFFIQPAILYAQKGFKQDRGGFFGYATNFEVKVEYFELPISILYKPKLWGNHLFIAAGPYIGFGTGGNWKSETSVVVGGDIVIGNRGDVIFRNDASNGGNLESYIYGRPVDYGANVLLGYEFLGKLTVQLNTQFGIANLQPQYGDFQLGGKTKNAVAGISIGYKF